MEPADVTAQLELDASMLSTALTTSYGQSAERTTVRYRQEEHSSPEGLGIHRDWPPGASAPHLESAFFELSGV
jgi:hypothetical protein